MKTQLTRLLMCAMILLTSCICVSATTEYNYAVQFKILSQTGYDNHEKEGDPDGMRKPGQHVFGIIDSRNGIQIPGLDKSQVVSYELYSEDVCLGSWPDEEDFLMQLTQQDGLVEIRINIPEYYLSGYIDLPI